MLTDRPSSLDTPRPAVAPRVLCVLDRHPLPADTAARRRLWNVLRGIAGVAGGTIVVLGGDTEPDRVDALAAALPAWDVVALPRDAGRAPVGRLRPDLGRARLPVHLARRDRSGWRAALATELGQGYDLVYTSHPRPFVLVEELTDLPIVASIDEVVPAAEDRTGPRLDQRICRRASVVLVPTTEARDALPGGRVMVLPDGADIPAAIAAPNPGRPPTVVLCGRMTDTADGAGEAFVLEHLVDEVRRRAPDACLRVVGRATDDVRALATLHPGVVALGHVDQVEVELAAADVVVVPAHRVGEARHRILDALAHGRPVITTSLGVHGLDLTPGRQILVADDTASTAAAITAVLRDPALAAALGHEGHRVARAHYDWAIVRHLVGEIVAGVAATVRPAVHR